MADVAPVKKTFWDRIGSGLAWVANATARAALVMSTHPEVVMTIASVAGHPEVGAAINAGNAVVAGIEKGSAK